MSEMIVKRIKLEEKQLQKDTKKENSKSSEINSDYSSHNGLKNQKQEWNKKDVITFIETTFVPVSHYVTEIKAAPNIIRWLGIDPFFSSFVFMEKPDSNLYSIGDLIDLDYLGQRSQKFNVPNYSRTVRGFLWLIRDYIRLRKEKEEEFQQQIEDYKERIKKEKQRQREIEEQRKRLDKAREKEAWQVKEADEIFNYSLGGVTVASVDEKYIKATNVSAPNVKNVKYDPSFPQIYTYIYAIVMDGEIVYVGSTHRPIEQRLGEHIACALKEKGLELAQQNHLYQQMRQKQYQFRILFKGAKGQLNQTQLEAMECGFIQLYQPKFNWEGRAVPFKFSGKDGKVYGGYESEG